MRRIALGALLAAANATLAAGLDPTNAASPARAHDPLSITPFGEIDRARAAHTIDASQTAACFACFRIRARAVNIELELEK